MTLGPNPQDYSEEIPLIDFADVNRNGMTDLVFVSKDKIYVYYNRH
jgi:hypothetical protein